MRVEEMKKKRVYIHQFQAASSKNLLPLAAGLLASYARSIEKIRRAYEIEIVILREDPKAIARSYHRADVLAFSAYSWNFQQSLETARLAKSADPHALIIFGGPMISGDRRELRAFFKRYPFIDTAVPGVGEWVFKQLLLSRLENRDLKEVRGAAVRDEASQDGFHFLAQEESFYDLDELPSPFLDGTFDDILEKNKDRISGVLWETNRGCPYSCSFCVQGRASFSKIVDFDLARLKKELEWISKKKMSYVFCCDANFGIRPRDIEITKAILHLSQKFGFPRSFVVNWIKNSSQRVIEIIGELWKGGLSTRLTLSMQSFNPPTLASVNRKNIRLSVFEDLVSACSKKGISTYTELILGLPEDSYETLRCGIGRCFDRRLSHFFVVYLCRLLSGTEMASPEFLRKYGIQTRTCRVGLTRHENFTEGMDEFEEVIVATKTLPVGDWQKAHTFVCTALVLYNFRLAFFVFNFLRREYALDISDCIEFIVAQAPKESSIGGVLQMIKRAQESILSEKGSYLVSLDFMENLQFEIHEGAMLMFLHDFDEFYCDLEAIIRAYLKEKNITPDPVLLEELFVYQRLRIPSFAKKNRMSEFVFHYNLAQYFKALCESDEPVELAQEESCVAVIGETQSEKPADFIRKRLTITSYTINDVYVSPLKRDHAGVSSSHLESF